MGRLEDKVVFITGTGGGQGRSAAQLFAREGAKVVGCDLKVDGNMETRALVEAEGGTMLDLAPVDLGDPTGAAEFVQRGIDEFGAIDVLYNNASAQRFAPFVDLTLDDWAFTMRNDLNLVFYVTKAAWPHLVARRGGSVINTSSGAAFGGTRKNPTTVAHSTAKAGVVGFTLALAAEGAPHGIRVNAIAPGLIETPVLAEHLTPEFISAVEAEIPMGRIGQPEDIARYALYLASDESTFVTATTLTMDGGQRASI